MLELVLREIPLATEASMVARGEAVTEEPPPAVAAADPVVVSDEVPDGRPSASG